MGLSLVTRRGLDEGSLGSQSEGSKRRAEQDCPKCEAVSPSTRISLYRMMTLVFHVRPNSEGAKGFRGLYEFIPETPYEAGVQTPPTNRNTCPKTCGYTIQSSTKMKGEILSPTYPGPYPRDFRCSYTLIGNRRQRIKLFFQDFDLYFGGDHCPYDSLTIHDGDSRNSPIIRKVCGIQQKLDLFSYKQFLYIEFNSGSPPFSDHRGYHINYLFSDQFVDIDNFINSQSGVSHLRGSECDLRVESNKETTHLIQSPNFPKQYKQNTSCVYYLDGLQGVQDLEKVILTFQSFSMGPLDKHKRLEEKCEEEEESVIIFMSPPDEGDNNQKQSDPDYHICGHMALEKPLRYKSEDFGIPGIPIGVGQFPCQFEFSSKRSKKGFFNSPRYPANYPTDTQCIYHLTGEGREQVRVFFEQFVLQRVSQNDTCGDYVELYDVLDTSEAKLLAKYCAGNFPGPVITSYGVKTMRVIFNSDRHYTHTGFKAFYDFIPRTRVQVPSQPNQAICGGQLETGAAGMGVLESPSFMTKYPTDLICNWEISVPQGHRILLTADRFLVEGEMELGNDMTPDQKPKSMNCHQAVVRIYLEKGKAFTREMCGKAGSEKKPPNHEYYTILSKTNWLRAEFLTSPIKVNGLKGFNFTFTEVKEETIGDACSSPERIKCLYNNYCISEKLRCNGAFNCGFKDETDEAHCNVVKPPNNQALIIGAASGGTVFLVILIIACLITKRQKKGEASKRASKNARMRKHHPSGTYSQPISLRTPLRDETGAYQFDV